MFFNVLNAKNLVDNVKENFDRKILLEDNERKLMIIALKKSEIIDTHFSPVDAAVYVIEGEIELHFDAEKFTLKKENILMFEKNKQHRVLANEDSIFLVIRI